MYPRLKPLAAILSLLPITAVAAETLQLAALDPVVVTATRQAQRASEVLSDVTVIEAEEIRNAGPAATLNQLLSRQPGIEINRIHFSQQLTCFNAFADVDRNLPDPASQRWSNQVGALSFNRCQTKKGRCHQPAARLDNRYAHRRQWAGTGNKQPETKQHNASEQHQSHPPQV